MAQVEIRVNGRAYKVTCENGQEQRLQQLANYLDRHVAELVDDLGQIGDARLMLLAALTICDELYETKSRLNAQATGNGGLDPDTLAGARNVIEAAARRIEAMAEKVA